MATITIDATTNAPRCTDSSGVLLNMLCWYIVGLGDPGSMTDVQISVVTITNGALTIPGITNTGSHTLILDNTAGSDMAARTVTAV